MGSVKDLVIIKEARDLPGEGTFVFSDRFSVFDYGVMPDTIESKGKALCMTAAYFFEKMVDMGVETHYLGLVEDGEVKSFDEVSEPTDSMRVKLFRVIKPKKLNGNYDYSVFKEVKGNFLLPLEIIYRNSIPEGSSLLRRLKEGLIKPQDFGLEKIEPNQKLEKPIVDFSTKLEDVDRYLSYEEARELAGLSDSEFEELKNLTLKIDELISKEVEKVGLENEDGKIEVAFNEKRRFVVVDAVGTPDECRFSFGGFEVSKELLRMYYRKTDWYEKVKAYKGKENWREIVGKPPRLPEEVKVKISEIYKAFCNDVTGKKFFDVPKIGNVVRDLKEVLQ